MSSGKKQPAVNFPTPAQLKERADNAKKCGTTYFGCGAFLHYKNGVWSAVDMKTWEPLGENTDFDALVEELRKILS